MIDVRAHLARKPLLFDGGMGTYYKAKPGTECEQGNLLDPAGVRKVHREYLEAGAEAIKTKMCIRDRRPCTGRAQACRAVPL